jgi:hypothetical protein
LRHIRSILYALVLAPAVWVLAGAGFNHDFTGRGRDSFATESYTGLLLLLLAGAAYGILLFAPISPAGPFLAGLAFLGVALWALAAPASYAGAWPPGASRDSFDLSRPGYGLAAMLAVPLICTALSARRWARYEPPVLPIIGQIGRPRGAAAVAGTPIAIAETAVIASPQSPAPRAPMPPPTPQPSPGQASPLQSASPAGRTADSGPGGAAFAPTKPAYSAGADDITAVVVTYEEPTAEFEEPSTGGGEGPTVVVPQEPAAGGEEPTVVVADEPVAGGEEPTVVVLDEPAAGSGKEPTVVVSDRPARDAEETTVVGSDGPARDTEEPTVVVSDGPARDAEEPTVIVVGRGAATRPQADEDEPTAAGAEPSPAGAEPSPAGAEPSPAGAPADEPTTAAARADEVPSDSAQANNEPTPEAAQAADESTAVGAQTDDQTAAVARADNEPSANGARADNEPAATDAQAGDEPTAAGARADNEPSANGARADNEPAATGAQAGDEPTGAVAGADKEPAATGAQAGDEPTGAVAGADKEPSANGAWAGEERTGGGAQTDDEGTAANGQAQNEPTADDGRAAGGEPFADATAGVGDDKPTAEVDMAGRQASTVAGSPDADRSAPVSVGHEPHAGESEPVTVDHGPDAVVDAPADHAETDPGVAPAAAAAHDATTGFDEKPGRRDEDETEAVPAVDTARPAAATLEDWNRATSGRGAGQADGGDQTQVLRLPPADVDGEQTQLIRLPSRITPPGADAGSADAGGPGERTRSIPQRAVREPGGDETQVIRIPRVTVDQERTQVIRPGTATPPGERTEVVKRPEPAAEQPTAPTSIAGAERPDFGSDPTSRIVVPPPRTEDPADAPAKPSMTVMNLERPPDEVADDTTRIEIPSQRRAPDDER